MGTKRTILIAAVAALLLAGSGFAVDPMVPSDLIGMNPETLQALLQSKHMTFTTSSYTGTNFAADASVATVTVATGKKGYLIGWKAGGTVAGYWSVYADNTNKHQSEFHGASGGTGWVFPPNWSAISATAGTTLEIRPPAQITGTYSATILVGEVDN